MTVIDQENPMWQKLYDMWVQQKRPGYVVLGSIQYKVLRPSDEEIRFVREGGFDDHYGSQSKIPS